MIELLVFPSADDDEIHAINPEQVASVSSHHDEEDGPESTVVTLKNGAEFHLAESADAVRCQVLGVGLL